MLNKEMSSAILNQILNDALNTDGVDIYGDYYRNYLDIFSDSPEEEKDIENFEKALEEIVKTDMFIDLANSFNGGDAND